MSYFQNRMRYSSQLVGVSCFPRGSPSAAAVLQDLQAYLARRHVDVRYTANGNLGDPDAVLLLTGTHCPPCTQLYQSLQQHKAPIVICNMRGDDLTLTLREEDRCFHLPRDEQELETLLANLPERLPTLPKT